MVLEIIIIKFSCILKIMSRNTFPKPQPDSASYACLKYKTHNFLDIGNVTLFYAQIAGDT